ncbi:MAG: acyltransferase family protein [Bacteroidales bacterium]|jgi:surface polysaccharide O-acyltransferase-like enzyme|nr:acyltransferase family protein [Bacteroidales bacterium]
MERITWLSNLRGFALIGIIFLHVVSGFLYTFSTPPSSIWWIGNVGDSMVRCCVPLFVMITGALLLAREIDLKKFFQKRFTRIVIPFVFWSFVYVVIGILRRGDADFLTALWNSNFWERLLKGTISFHLWYVYMLIGLLVLVPVLNTWIRHCSEKEILYFLVLWLVSIFLSNTFLQRDLKLIYFSSYVGYLVLGYYLAYSETYTIGKLRLKTGGKLVISNTLLWIIVGGIALLVTIFGTYYSSLTKGKFNGEFYEYLMPNVVFAAIAVFLLVKQCVLKNNIVLKIIRFLDKYSYGIYLVHIFVLTYLRTSLGISSLFIHPLIGIPLTTILCLAVSAGIIYVVNHIPFVGKYISG